MDVSVIYLNQQACACYGTIYNPPTSITCSNCLFVKWMVLIGKGSPGPGKLGLVDLSALNSHLQGKNMTYRIHSADASGFMNTWIDGTKLLMQMKTTAIENQNYELFYIGKEIGTNNEAAGKITVYVRDLCADVQCPGTCNRLTGLCEDGGTVDVNASIGPNVTA